MTSSFHIVLQISFVSAIYIQLYILHGNKHGFGSARKETAVGSRNLVRGRTAYCTSWLKIEKPMLASERSHKRNLHSNRWTHWSKYVKMSSHNLLVFSRGQSTDGELFASWAKYRRYNVVAASCLLLQAHIPKKIETKTLPSLIIFIRTRYLNISCLHRKCQLSSPVTNASSWLHLHVPGIQISSCAIWTHYRSTANAWNAVIPWIRFSSTCMFLNGYYSIKCSLRPPKLV